MVPNITTSGLTDGPESAVSWLNKLARDAPDGRLYPDEYDPEDIRELAVPLSEAMADYADRNELAARCAELTETSLSDREVDVVALKELGLTHDAIALAMTYWGGPDTGSVSPSTVDEYSRRAREKFQRAQRTVEELRDTYGGGPD